MNFETDKALRSKLLADATVFASVGTRIYKILAPAKVILPFIVFEYLAGGSTNNTPRDALDVRYRVRVISDNPQEASSIADAVRDALHEQELTFDLPWKHEDCNHVKPFQLVENVEQSQRWTYGNEFRIRATK